MSDEAPCLIRLLKSDPKDNLSVLEKTAQPKTKMEIFKIILVNFAYLALAAGIGTGLYFLMLDKSLQVCSKLLDFPVRMQILNCSLFAIKNKNKALGYNHAIVGVLIVVLNYIFPLVCDLLDLIEQAKNKIVFKLVRLVNRGRNQHRWA